MHSTLIHTESVVCSDKRKHHHNFFYSVAMLFGASLFVFISFFKAIVINAISYSFMHTNYYLLIFRHHFLFIQVYVRLCVAHVF